MSPTGTSTRAGTSRPPTALRGLPGGVQRHQRGTQHDLDADRRPRGQGARGHVGPERGGHRRRLREPQWAQRRHLGAVSATSGASVSWHAHPHYQVITMAADANGIFVGGGGGGGNFAKFSRRQPAVGRRHRRQRPGDHRAERHRLRRRPLRELLRAGGGQHVCTAPPRATSCSRSRPRRAHCSRGIPSANSVLGVFSIAAPASRWASVATSPARASARSRISRFTDNGRPHRWGACGRPTGGASSIGAGNRAIGQYVGRSSNVSKEDH